MNLPKQVQEASDNSDRLIKAMTEQDTTEQPELETPAEAESPRQSAPEQERTDYKAKYLVLQGKYNAEVPRLHAENRELKGEIDSLKERFDALQNSPTAVESKGETPEMTDEINEKLDNLRAEWGDDAYDGFELMVKKHVSEEVGPIKGKVDETWKERQEAKTRKQREDDHRQFLEAVSDLIPDWEKINVMPEFHEYLEQRIGDGRMRQELLNDAASALDVVTAARIFAAFRRSGNAQTGGAAPKGKRDTLASKSVPQMAGRDRGGSEAATSWTADQVKKVYQDAVQGRIPPEKFAQIEREIEAARQSGNIR